jgi:hypothetical protein
MLPHTSAIDVVPLWAVFVGSVVTIIVAVELGYRLGRWRHRRAEHETEGAVGGMVAAELGLLAFLLAITFSLAASRFDDRRTIVLDEANAIGTCYLRAAMLPPDHREAVRRALREYVDVRLAAMRGGSLDEAIRRTDALHNVLWNHATAAAEQDPRSVPVGLFVGSLNDVIDLHAKRLQAGLRSRLPFTIWAALFAISMLSFTAMGYHEGLSGTRRSPAIVAVTLGFAIVIWLVADLERPHQGMLRVSQQPMVDLQKSMSAEQ